MKVKEAQKKELIENQLRRVIIDRMLKEKYNEIEYLAIQPPCDPGIVEVNREDLDWLLSEHDKAEALEQEQDKLKKQILDIENQNKKQIEACRQEYDILCQQYRDVINSNTWKMGIRIGKIIHILLTPFRWLRGGK